MQIIRATKTAEQAGAYYVRIQARYIVIVDDYLPIATCRLYALDPERVVFGRIVVLPEYRHQGLGTRVVQEAEAWARELGFRTAIVESRENKVPFYENMGYVADFSPAKSSAAPSPATEWRSPWGK